MVYKTIMPKDKIKPDIGEGSQDRRWMKKAENNLQW
jgi:hypothetical protein